MPTAKMRPPRVPGNPPPVLREDDLRALLATCGHTGDFEGRRDTAILLVFIDTGVRLSELANLRVALDETENDVDLDQGVVRVIGKGSRERVPGWLAKTSTTTNMSAAATCASSRKSNRRSCWTKLVSGPSWLKGWTSSQLRWSGFGLRSRSARNEAPRTERRPLGTIRDRMLELALTTDAIPEPRRWYGAFLAALRNSCNVRASCTTAGIHRSTAYEARQRDPLFATAWEDTLGDAIETLEAHARAMAFAGDTIMTIFLLTAHRPEVYRDRYEVKVREHLCIRFVPAMGGVHAEKDARAPFSSVGFGRVALRGFTVSSAVSEGKGRDSSATRRVALCPARLFPNGTVSSLAISPTA